MSIEVNNVTKKFGKTLALNDVSLTVNKGDIIGIIGPNGAGKTTIMKIISGITRNFDGTVLIDQEDLKQYNNINFEKRIGMLIENPKYIKYKTGRANLKYFHNYFAGSKHKVDFSEEINTFIKHLSMAEFIDKKVSKYSLGMKQRLGIAIAMQSDPDYIILDEPTNGMDKKSTFDILKYIQTLKKLNKGVLISSHQLNIIEHICDKIYAIENGKILGVLEMNKFIKEHFVIKFSSIDDFEAINNNLNVIEKISENVCVVEAVNEFYDIVSTLRKASVNIDIESRTVLEVFYDDLYRNEFELWF